MRGDAPAKPLVPFAAVSVFIVAAGCLFLPSAADASTPWVKAGAYETLGSSTDLGGYHLDRFDLPDGFAFDDPLAAHGVQREMYVVGWNVPPEVSSRPLALEGFWLDPDPEVGGTRYVAVYVYEQDPGHERPQPLTSDYRDDSAALRPLVFAFLENISAQPRAEIAALADEIIDKGPGEIVEIRGAFRVNALYAGLAQPESVRSRWENRTDAEFDGGYEETWKEWRFEFGMQQLDVGRWDGGETHRFAVNSWDSMMYTHTGREHLPAEQLREILQREFQRLGLGELDASGIDFVDPAVAMTRPLRGP